MHIKCLLHNHSYNYVTPSKHSKTMFNHNKNYSNNKKKKEKKEKKTIGVT